MNKRVNSPRRVKFEELPPEEQAWLIQVEDNDICLADGTSRVAAEILYESGNDTWRPWGGHMIGLVRGFLAQGAISIRKNVPKKALKALGIEEK